MKSLKTFVFSVLMLASFSDARAQKDTVTVLQEVVIQQSRLDSYAVGHYTLRIDSLIRQLAIHNNLADLMRQYGFGHIRSYGPSGLSTPSFRGSGASHTSILWNGINLQSPLNGQADLALMPVLFIDGVTLQSGGSASLFGSGAIGGTIHLNSKASFNNGWIMQAQTAASSIQNYTGGLSINWSGKKFISTTRLFYGDFNNRFRYVNKYFNPVRHESRVHAGALQQGLLQENYWQLNPRQLVSFRFWYQNNETEVPAPVTVPQNAVSQQRDQFFRSAGNWSYEHGRLHLSYQGSHVYHLLSYQDASINVDSRSTFHSFINNAEATIHFNERWEATSGINFTKESGTAVEYSGNNPERNRSTVLGVLQYVPFHHSKNVFSFRQEWVNGSPVPISPSWGSEWTVGDHLKLYGNLSRNYRIPTFNDLYWKDAGATGNPNLLPELSWSSEMGASYSWANTSGTLVQFKGGLFNNNVNDWILWSPEGQIWSPNNIKKVWARGLESSATVDFSSGQIFWKLKGLYSLTRSTNEAIHNNDFINEVGRQLIYTPLHEGSCTLQSAFKKTSVTLTGNFTGKQFTDGSNNPYYALKPYTAFHLWINQNFFIKAHSSNVTLEFNNLLNKSYEARTGYPMPGRNFKIALSIRVHKKQIQ